MSSLKRKRKTARLTLPSKKGQSQFTGDHRDRPPTEKEWRTQMVRAKSFKHTDTTTGRIVVVRELDDVILHSMEDKSNTWLGQVVSIRCRQSELQDNLRRAWVRVRWYYSSRDIVEFYPSLITIASYFSPNERALSDKYDILEFNEVKGPVHVYPWSEPSLDPPDIGKGDFFMRGTFSTGLAQLSSPSLVEHACNICRIAYNPFPLSGSNSDLIQHFCPMPNCRQWYHRHCLVKSHLEDPHQYVGTRGIRLLAVDPDMKDPHVKFSLYTYPRPSRGKMSAVSDEDNVKPWEPLMDELTHGKPGKEGFEGKGLGKDILKMAMQPIVRAPDGTSFSIAGNVSDVILARRFIYSFYEGWHDILREVEPKLAQLDAMMSSAPCDIELDHAEMEITSSDLKDDLSMTRLLASPYAPYWAKRTETLHEDWLSTAPPLRCPGCGGAI